MRNPWPPAIILISACVLLPAASQAQQKDRLIVTQRGQTEFFSKAAGPAQDIQAIDKTGKVSLNLTNGDIRVEIQMKNFTLPKSLMQKHYNERYMQTDRYPEATFTGKIRNWNQTNSDTVNKVIAYGNFTVHGVTHKREIQGILTKKGSKYLLDATFEVKLADHNIEIPVLFFTKITEAVKVTARYELAPGKID